MTSELMVRGSLSTARASSFVSEEPSLLTTASECLWNGIIAGKSPSWGPVPDRVSLCKGFPGRGGIVEDSSRSGAGPLELFKGGLLVDTCLCT